MESILHSEDMMLFEMKVNDYLYENTIYLDSELDREVQIKFGRQLKKLAEKELAKPKDERNNVKIKISSYGGMVISVFYMATMMEYWQEKGVTIETHCDGFTASGGAWLLMAGSKGHRYITRYGNVLFHQPNGHKYGISTLQEDIKNLENSVKDWAVLKGMIKKHTKISDRELEDYTEKNIDFIYNPQECVEKSIVDHII